MPSPSLSPFAIGLGVGVAAAVVVLNVAALTLHADYPWLPALDFVVDMSLLGIGVFAFVRQGMRADAREAEAQAALDASQARLAAIVDSAMDAIITIDERQRIVLFNRAAEAMFRCSRNDILDQPLDRLLPSRFRAGHKGFVERFGRTGDSSRRMGKQQTLWALRQDGDEEFPIEASISQVVESGQRYFTVVIRDVTRRLEYEEAERQRQEELRELSARALEAREEEKTMIGRELHDELGQLLTALKMDVSWMRERLPAGEAELAAKAAGLSELLDRTVGSMRRISADLRPLMLDDLGLPDAAAWLVDDFAERSAIECKLEMARDGSLDDVDKGVATAVYRVLQESLTNIARHSKARAAWIALSRDAAGVRLDVEDDGVGIPDERLSGTRSLGLKGMRERLLYLGGSIEIARAPRGGTRVSARFPVKAVAQ